MWAIIFLALLIRGLRAAKDSDGLITPQLPGSRAETSLSFSDLLSRAHQCYNKTYNVSISLHLAAIISVDLARETFSTKQEIFVSWYDSDLQWNPMDFDDFEVFHANTDSICFPDVSLQESLEIIKLPLKTVNHQVSVTHEGRVTFALSHTYLGYCDMDVTYFPFDTQICHQIFYSLTQHKEIMDIYPMKGGGATGNTSVDECECLRYYHINQEWDMVKVSVERFDWLDDTVTGQKLTYSYIDYMIEIRRKPWFYIWSCIISSSMLVCVSCVALFTASHSTEVRQSRPQVGLVALLSIAVQLLTGPNNQSVATSHAYGLPILSTYFIVLLVIMVVAIILHCVITQIHHVILQQHHPLPMWAMKYFSKPRLRGICTTQENEVNAEMMEQEREIKNRPQIVDAIMTRVDYVCLCLLLLATFVNLVWFLSHGAHDHPPQTVWNKEYGVT